MDNKSVYVKPNPFKALAMSRKFLLMVLDVVISLTTYFITKYANPEAAKDVLMVLGVLQPVFVTLIASIAYEDGKNIDSETSTQLFAKGE